MLNRPSSGSVTSCASWASSNQKLWLPSVTNRSTAPTTTARVAHRAGADIVRSGAGRDIAGNVTILAALPARRMTLASGCAALLCASAIVGCGGTSRRAVQTTTRTDPLISIYEADPQLRADPAGTITTLRSLGADTLRVFMPWGTLGSLQGVAPAAASPQPPPGFNGADPASYPASSWAYYDTVVRLARERGMQVDLTLGPPPPLWARGAGDPGHPVHPQWRPSPALFGAFVHAVATRYSGHYQPPGATTPLPAVRFWGLWNEPNFGPMLAPQIDPRTGQVASAAIYRSFVDAAWSALGATGHGHDVILIGELAPRGVSLGAGPRSFGYMVPLRFLRALYCVGDDLKPLSGAGATAVGCPASTTAQGFVAAHPGLFDASGFALHPYEFGPPTAATPGEPDYADLAALPHVEATIDKVLAAHGSNRRYPIYNTEFGYETNPPETVIGTVSPTLAAAYSNESEYLSWKDPRMRSFDQYLLTDPPSAVFATGLRFADGRPKPGLAAYRMPMWLPRQSFSHGQAIEVWGRVRPARYSTVAGRTQVAVIQFRAAGSGSFRDLARVRLSAPNFTFDVVQAFPGSGAVRVAWRPPGRPASFSRTVTISSR